MVPVIFSQKESEKSKNNYLEVEPFCFFKQILNVVVSTSESCSPYILPNTEEGHDSENDLVLLIHLLKMTFTKSILA